MFDRQTAVLHRVCHSRAEYVAFCRFFNNSKVSHQQIALPLIQQTAQAAAGRTVLALQDTSEFNFEHHAGYLSRADAELVPTGNDKDIGYFLHPCVVIDKETGLLLGASDVHLWNRRYDKQDKHERKYAQQQLEEKESYRWIACAQRSKEVLSEATSILFVSDRESDIYEEFALLPDARSDVLVRSRENRRLHNKDEKLYEHLQSQPEA